MRPVICYPSFLPNRIAVNFQSGVIGAKAEISWSCNPKNVDSLAARPSLREFSKDSRPPLDSNGFNGAIVFAVQVKLIVKNRKWE
jgi:hypothetical protein